MTKTEEKFNKEGWIVKKNLFDELENGDRIAGPDANEKIQIFRAEKEGRGESVEAVILPTFTKGVYEVSQNVIGIDSFKGTEKTIRTTDIDELKNKTEELIKEIG